MEGNGFIELSLFLTHLLRDLVVYFFFGKFIWLAAEGTSRGINVRA